MALTSKSPQAVALVALATARRSLPAYSHKNSPKTFTQHQLFACLALKNFLKTDYRGIVAHLADHRSRRLSTTLPSRNRDLNDQTPPRRPRPRPIASQPLSRPSLARTGPQRHDSLCSEVFYRATHDPFPLQSRKIGRAMRIHPDDPRDLDEDAISR